MDFLGARSEKVSFSKERRREVVFPFALRRVTFRHVAERSVAWSSSRSSGADVQKELTVKTNDMPAAMPAPTATAPNDAAPRKTTPSEATKVRAIATLEVFLGGASYGFMATSYKLSYAAGFTSNQVVAGQGWFGLILFAIAFAVSMVRGKRWQRVGARSALSLMGLGCITCCTSILYCYAMSVLPVSVALTLLFQFTWIGTVLQIILTRKPPALSQVIAAAVVIVGTVFASGVYKTGIAGYDSLGLVCGFGAAISCACFVTFSGRVKAPCSNEQRGMIVCAGVVIASHVVCPDFIVSGALLDGFAPYAFVCGLFGMTLPVLLFGLGTPHLTPGMSTIMTSAELPAGLLLAMLVLGEPISAVEWLGVAIILAGVCIAQVRLGKRTETTPLPTD